MFESTYQLRVRAHDLQHVSSLFFSFFFYMLHTKKFYHLEWLYTTLERIIFFYHIKWKH